jgi:hypothetical protein
MVVEAERGPKCRRHCALDIFDLHRLQHSPDPVTPHHSLLGGLPDVDSDKRDRDGVMAWIAEGPCYSDQAVSTHLRVLSLQVVGTGCYRYNHCIARQPPYYLYRRLTTLRTRLLSMYFESPSCFTFPINWSLDIFLFFTIMSSTTSPIHCPIPILYVQATSALQSK